MAERARAASYEPYKPYTGQRFADTPNEINRARDLTNEYTRVYVPYLNLNSTPNTNTTADSVLVRNTTTGDVENRSINSLINTNNTVTVALTGSTGVDFNSIKSKANIFYSPSKF